MFEGFFGGYPAYRHRSWHGNTLVYVKTRIACASLSSGSAGRHHKVLAVGDEAKRNAGERGELRCAVRPVKMA